MVLCETPKLGSWNISDLVNNENKNSLKAILNKIEKNVERIEDKRNILTDDISSNKFLSLLSEIEHISEQLNIVMGYAHLKYAANTFSNENASLLTELELIGTNISNRLLFFDLWFKNFLSESDAERLIRSAPKIYSNYLEHKRALGKYTLSEKEEKLINIFDVTGPNALIKIYDRFTSEFEFTLELKHKKIRKKFDSKEKLISLVRSPDPKEREYAYKALFTTYKKHSGILGEIYINLMIQWFNENLKIRGFESPISVRNISNNINDATVNTLLHVCESNSNVFQKYFKLKSRILNIKKFSRYHLYAPISSQDNNPKKYPYKKSVDLVLETFQNFDPLFRKFAERVFNEKHIDSKIKRGKISGAFCSTISPKKTPYVLLNYNGYSRDVSTMAHELGHAIHSMCSSKLPISISHAPLPLAETASVFAEMLLNDQILSKLNNDDKIIMLSEQIDDMYATIMRQAFFTLFEINAHKEIVQKNGSIDDLCLLYMKNLKTQFGDAVIVNEDFKWEWSYIPHFYHSPFYCYAYAFGNLLVLSLYQQFKQEGKSFIPKYIKLLSAGGSKKPEILLSEMNIDISKDSFWQQGFNLVSEKIRQLEDLIKTN